jgi:hypothetical protein
MPNQWITVAPLHSLWTMPATLPFRFDDRISIRPIADELLTESADDPLRSEFIKATDKVSHCLMIE